MNSVGAGRSFQRRRAFLRDLLVDFVRRDFALRGGLREALLSAFAAANSRRFLAAQPGLFDCRPRAMPSPSAGTFSVIVEPAAIYAPSPSRRGATSAELLPMKTRLPISVGFLTNPS